MSYDKSFAQSIFNPTAQRDLRSQLNPVNTDAVSQYGAAFSAHALNDSLIDELYHIQYATIYGKDERPYCPKIISEAIDIFKFEAVSEQEKSVYDLLFKGVNKRLPMPIFVQPLRKSALSGKGRTQATACYSCCIVEEQEVVSFNVKNLVRHYKYPLADAKALYKQFSSIHHSDNKLKLLKTGIQPKDSWNVRVTITPEQDIVNWRLPLTLSKLQIDEVFDEADMENLIALAEMDLPITNIETWRRMATRHYETQNDSLWIDLSDVNKKRFVVNFIRHNSIYSEVWKKTQKSISSQAHDIVFDRIARKIIRTFPSLSSVAKEQLNNLHDGKRG